MAHGLWGWERVCYRHRLVELLLLLGKGNSFCSTASHSNPLSETATLAMDTILAIRNCNYVQKLEAITERKTQSMSYLALTNTHWQSAVTELRFLWDRQVSPRQLRERRRLGWKLRRNKSCPQVN